MSPTRRMARRGSTRTKSITCRGKKSIDAHFNRRLPFSPCKGGRRLGQLESGQLWATSSLVRMSIMSRPPQKKSQKNQQSMPEMSAEVSHCHFRRTHHKTQTFFRTLPLKPVSMSRKHVDHEYTHTKKSLVEYCSPI